MVPCKYCAIDDTKKDHFGYCIKYNCFEQSGQKAKLDSLIKRASDIWTMPDTIGQVSGPITNLYRQRTRTANDIMWDAEKEFGFVPQEVIDRIPEKNREKWDKNIRW